MARRAKLLAHEIEHLQIGPEREGVALIHMRKLDGEEPPFLSGEVVGHLKVWPDLTLGACHAHRRGWCVGDTAARIRGVPGRHAEQISHRPQRAIGCRIVQRSGTRRSARESAWAGHKKRGAVLDV